MGFSGISVWSLLLILLIVVLLFGTKRLGSIGSDLGKAIKGFKKSVKDDDEEPAETENEAKRNVENQPNDTSTKREQAESEDKTRQ